MDATIVQRKVKQVMRQEAPGVFQPLSDGEIEWRVNFENGVTIAMHFSKRGDFYTVTPSAIGPGSCTIYERSTFDVLFLAARFAVRQYCILRVLGYIPDDLQ